MKKFKFSLEKVLDVKKSEEKILQKELVVLQRELYDKENESKKIRRKINKEFKRKEKLNRKVTNSSKIMMIHKYIQNLQMEFDRTQETISQLIIKVENARQRLLEKVKEKKSIEKLKELKYEKYKKQQKKTEQEFLDEISSQKGNNNGLQEAL